MKQLICIITSVMLLTACGSSSSASSDLSSDRALAETDNASSASEDIRAHMELYECLEIALLGCSDSQHSPEAVLKDARERSNLSWLSSLSDPAYVYGETSERNYVYLILPAEQTDLRIGRYSWHAGEITDVYYEAEQSGPVIFTENADSYKPLSQIEYVRHLDGSENEDRLYSGFSLTDSRLRTMYHMGIVDVTEYDLFTTAEIPDYSQSFFDRLNEFDEVKTACSQGGTLSVMGELFYEDEMYAMYDLQKEDRSHCAYAISPDRSLPILYSEDYETWTVAAGG